jgi:hypothetical protein
MINVNDHQQMESRTTSKKDISRGVSKFHPILEMQLENRCSTVKFKFSQIESYEDNLFIKVGVLKEVYNFIVDELFI